VIEAGQLMSHDFGTHCDDFHASYRLFLKLDLPLERDTVLHFFERITKEIPSMNKLRRRDDGCLMLEEDTGPDVSKRWLRLDPNSIRFGFFGPPNVTAMRDFSEIVFEHAPYHFSFSPIDYDHLELIYGFDLEYKGNHDQLVADTFCTDHPFGGFVLGDDSHHVIDAQPYFGIALTPECDLQAYIETKSRTSTYEIRTGEFERQPLSVFLTIRKYWTGNEPTELKSVAFSLFQHADNLSHQKVIPLVVGPLAQAIATRL
jgi:hypothetical protein